MSKKSDEIARWQQAIYELCQEHYPDVDGSGCDSGDELDLTLAEISEVFNMYQDQIDELEAMNKKLMAVAAAAHKIMLSAQYDEMYGWQLGDASLDVLVSPLSEVYEAGMVGGTS